MEENVGKLFKEEKVRMSNSMELTQGCILATCFHICTSHSVHLFSLYAHDESLTLHANVKRRKMCDPPYLLNKVLSNSVIKLNHCK